MRERPRISEKQIQGCLQEKYGLIATNLDFLPLGMDDYAWVYRVISESGMRYFLKLKQRAIYPSGCLVPRFLNEQGLSGVVAPIPTNENKLWTQLGELVAILYPFIEGRDGYGGMAGWHWQELGATLKGIHSVILLPQLFPGLKKEQFEVREYLWLREFDQKLLKLQSGNALEAEFIAAWKVKRETVNWLLSQMVTLAEILRDGSLEMVICHADLHPGNVLIDGNDQLFLIDWDEVMVAPKERDFIFIETGENSALGTQSDVSSPFFQGYGKAEIDWIALTYYRCERVVQDIIAFAQQVFFRSDINEETRAEAVHWFGKIFEPGGEVESALNTSQHLPPHLAIS